MEFASRAGQEMFRLLAERALQELSLASRIERFSTLLAASLIPVAEVLREPVEKAADGSALKDKLIALTLRQLSELLAPASERTSGLVK